MQTTHYAVEDDLSVVDTFFVIGNNSAAMNYSPHTPNLETTRALERERPEDVADDTTRYAATVVWELPVAAPYREERAGLVPVAAGHIALRTIEA